MGTWNSISGWFQSGNGVSGGKKAVFLSIAEKKKIRDFNLSPFRKIEPDQVKSLCATYGEKEMFLSWGSNPCHKSLWCHEGLLKKC